MTPDERFEKWWHDAGCGSDPMKDVRAAWDEQQREIDRLIALQVEVNSESPYDSSPLQEMDRLRAKLREAEEDGRRVMTDLARCAIERDQMKRERDQAVWRDDGHESKLRDALSALEVANISLTDQERKIDELKAKLREVEEELKAFKEDKSFHEMISGYEATARREAYEEVHHQWHKLSTWEMFDRWIDEKIRALIEKEKL